jgi:hypothetical protein
LLRPFFAFLTVFLHNCSAMRELLPFLAPRFFQPLPIVIFLHFSYHDCVGVAFKLLHKKRSFRIIRGRQREPKSDPCARLQTQEMWRWWLLSAVVSFPTVYSNGTKKTAFLPLFSKKCQFYFAIGSNRE